MEILRQKNPNLKETSITAYYNNLERLRKRLGYDDWSYIDDMDKTLDFLKDLKPTTQRNYLNAIMVACLSTDKSPEHYTNYEKRRNECSKMYEASYKENPLTESQQKNKLPMSDIRNMINAMKTDVDKLSGLPTQSETALIRAYTLFSCLCDTPLRNEFSNMIYTSEAKFKKVNKENKNFLVKNKNEYRYVINNHKTFKRYGTKVIPVPPNSLKVLKQYIKRYNFHLGDTIFPMTTNAISQLLLKQSNAYTGKRISTTMIRKMFVENEYGHIKKKLQELQPEIDKQEKHANEVMGHSLSVENAIYNSA